MIKRYAVIAFLWVVLASVGVSRGQITILGKDSRDQWLDSFFGQQSNVPKLILGLNANASGYKFSDTLLPDSISGKIFDGTFTGTNRLQFRVWDTNAAAYQIFEFTFNGTAPVSSNAVSRVGYPETNSFKTLNNWRLQTNGVDQAGVPVAIAGQWGKTVAGKSGLNRVKILHTYETGGTRYLEWNEGVFTDAQ